MKSPTALQNEALQSPAELTLSTRWALASLSGAMLLSSLGTSIANVGLPALGEAFSAPFQQVQWVVLAYLLAITIAVVSAGRLGDLFGRRRLLLAGLVLFTLASALCGFAPTLSLLIVARAAQGLGAAFMMALTLALVNETVSRARTGSAMGLLGTVSAAGTALGPSLGGVLIAGFGWPAAFLVNAPLGLLVLLLAYRYLPADRRNAKPHRTNLDPAGMSLLTLTLAAYALAMTWGRGQFGTINGMLLAAAAFGTGLFAWVETKAPSPMIPLAVFRNPKLRAGFSTSALVATVVMATLVVGPFYLAGALRLDTFHIGLVMSSGPLVAALVGVPAGRFVDRFGANQTSLAGLIVMAAGAAALALLPARFGVPAYIAPLVILTAGYALFQAANNTGVLNATPQDQRGVISGLLSLSRNLGLITGASFMGAVFAAGSAASGVPATGPLAIADGLHLTFAVATVLIFVAMAIVLAATRAPRVLATNRSRPVKLLGGKLGQCECAEETP